MGRYSTDGGDRFDSLVEADLHAICHKLTNPDIEAIVLVGAPARGEGTPFEGKPYNDYDIVVVARKKIQVPPIKLSIPVDVSVKTTKELRAATCTLFNYEMRYAHKVIFGPQNILDIMPEWKKEALPLLEGTQLLVNRGTLHLLEESDKYFMKLALALGDSAFLAMKCHEISYQKKLLSFRDFFPSWNIPETNYLSDIYEKAIRFKLSGHAAPIGKEEWTRLLTYFEQFALWYEGIRLGRPIHSLDEYIHTIAEAPFSLFHAAQNLIYFRSLHHLFAPPAAKLLAALLFLNRREPGFLTKKAYLDIWRRYA